MPGVAGRPLEAAAPVSGRGDADVEREREVNQSIRQLSLTRVIVAHRPETIASASRVIVMQDGRVAQDLPSMPGGGNNSHAK